MSQKHQSSLTFSVKVLLFHSKSIKHLLLMLIIESRNTNVRPDEPIVVVALAKDQIRSNLIFGYEMANSI